ncbi:MAG TPA: helix-hairpin-helix domain-containing protein [Candidatus Didemnitutus sp.]|jgi:hypothetical protein
MKVTDPLTIRLASLRALQEIPGIGPSLAADLYSLGIRRVADLRRQDPEKLYHRLERQTQSRQDPCVLYTFRCAVYYARTPKPQPRLLKWWNWKDADGRTKRRSR